MIVIIVKPCPFQIPESSKLHYGVDKNTGRVNKYPLVNVRNVYVFPGVPPLMEKAFTMLEVSADLLHIFSSTITSLAINRKTAFQNSLAIANSMNK